MAGVKCQVVVESRQKMGEDTNVSVETCDGLFMERSGSKYISYKRKTEDGEVTALITLSFNEMSISQKGSLNTSLRFVPKERTSNEYGTPQGIINIDIFTKNYQVFHLKESLKIQLEYDLITGFDPITTDMVITVKML